MQRIAKSNHPSRFLENLTTKTRSSPSFVHLRAEPFPARTSPNQTLTSNLTVTVILFSFRRAPSLQPGGCLVHCGHVGHGVSRRNLYRFQDERAQGLSWYHAAAGIFHDRRPDSTVPCDSKAHTKWINMMYFKRGLMPNPVRDFTPFNTQISPPGSNINLPIGALPIRNQSTRRNQVNLQNHGCGRFRL